MKIQFARAARSSPDAIAGITVPYATAKRAAPRWRWYLILALVASPAVVLVLGMLGGSVTRSAHGTVALDQLEVRALAAGRVTNVSATPGMAVSAQDSLVTTTPVLATPAANIPQSRLHPVNDARPTAATTAAVTLRARALRLARERRDAIELLVTRGAATRPELREAQIALDAAEDAWLQAQSVLRRAGVQHASASEIQPGDAVTAHAAPFAGKVLDVFVTPGEIVRAGDPLALVARNTNPSVIAYVAPDIATRIGVGSTATIRFADGTRASAHVAQPARVTRRLPADMVDNFGMRPMMVVLMLGTADAWPPTQAIHGMPVRIRFHYSWESSTPGKWFTPVLDRLAGTP